MKKNIIQIYNLSICFTSTIVLMITCAFILSEVNSLIFFNQINRKKLTKYSTNTNYLAFKKNKSLNKKNKVALEKIRINEKNIYITNAKYDIYNNLIKSLPWLIVSTIFLIIHYTLYIFKSKRQ